MMQSLKSISRWWVFLVGVILILTGVSLLFGVAVPSAVMGVLAVVAGFLAILSV